LKLLDIPGVGARIRDHLNDHFKSEEAALDAVLRGDVAALLEVLSERQALSLVQWATGIKYGAEPEGFLATDESRRIYQFITTRMATYAHTEYARLKIGTIFPSFSPKLIMDNRKLAEDSLDWAMKLDGIGIGNLLSKIKPLRERPQARIRDRALLAASPEILQLLRSRGLDKLIDIHMVECEREMIEAAKGYSHVCTVGDSLGDSMDWEIAESMEDWYLVPEAVLGYYKDNLDILLSALEAARMLQDAGIRSFDGLEEIQKLIQRLSSSGDAESARLAGVLENMSRCINEAADWANNELKRRIESSQVTLAGMDILQALGRGEGIRDLFEVQMSGIFRDVLKEAKERATSGLDLSKTDAARLDDIFNTEIQYPLELDRQSLQDFEQELRSRLETRTIKSRRELAKGLADKKESVKKIINALKEFDFAYALGTFAFELGLEMPEIVDQPSLGFNDGKNLFLERPEPVSYSLGDTGLIDFTERTVLLSGVNSGGKTSLLDLLAQIVILAHMGMPVPAKNCRLCIFQELYYFGKSRGTLSAGAFETAMRKFSQVENSNRKLILADELEAITEPGASAKIIACMLDEINQLGSMAVFVSHLAEEVKRFAKAPVRVDGIEASGLDAENRLIVRRTPRYNYLAKSTPELILDRLVRTTSGQEKEFYSRLLAKFK
jgi:DNA mismatch repair protein MutS2